VAVSAKGRIMKKKPMKTKRYDEGDLVEADFKKKGLDSSKDDRVGFFERLRMGNIDSPKSEAYRRFGAGRARTDADIASRMQDRAVTGAAPNQDISRMGSTVPDGQVSSPFLMGRVPIGGTREASSMSSESSDDLQRRANMGEPAQSAMGRPPASTEVVKSTAAKITKSKGSSLPKNKKASGYQIDEEGPAQIGSQNTFNMDKSFEKKSEGSLAPLGLGMLGALLGASALSKRAKQGGTKPIDSRPSSGGKNPRLMGIDPMMEGDLERMAGEGGANFKKGGKAKAKAKPMQKFASGGSVSSASKRGDGIAQKGKTKGRIC
jgi:hypothetical protein